MIVLGVDTGGSACSVALWRNGIVLARRMPEMTHGHAEALVPLIADTAAEAGIGLADIGLFGVTVGPGAFTGLRIGIAAVGGMALAAGRPIVGVGSFEAFARATGAEERAGRSLLVAIDSRRAELFAQLFHDDLTPASDPDWMAPETLPKHLPPGPALVAGDAGRAAMDALSARPQTVASTAPPRIDPAIVAALAAERADQAGLDPPAPFYLRPPDAVPGPARGHGHGPARRRQ